LPIEPVGAYGLDAAAHRAALSAEGVTVAVLACGVDVPCPAGHADLLDAIAAHGVVVSEWPPGRNATRLRFLVRNRTIAALAAGNLGGRGRAAQRRVELRAARARPRLAFSGGAGPDQPPSCPLARVRAVRSTAWRLSSHDERSQAQPTSRPLPYFRYHAQMQSAISVATGPSSPTRKHDRSQALRK
jgi:hypothetical protein